MHPYARSLGPLVARCALSAALLASSTATASGVAPGDATTAQKAEAMGHFAAGKEAIAQQNWDRAAAELRASLEVVDSPNARLVLARALRDSGRTTDAWAEYGRAVDDATKFDATEDRYAKTAEAATAERGELEGTLAFVAVTVAHAPPDATLKVAGRLVPADEWTSPVAVPAGAVDVLLADAGGRPLARQTVSASFGQKTPVMLDVQPPPPRPVPPPTEPAEGANRDLALPIDAPSAGSDRSKLRPYAYVVGGMGVAGLALFTVFGLMDNWTYRDLQGACPRNYCPPGKQTEIDAGRTQQTVANASLVLGAVGIAAGATLFALSLAPRSSATGLVVVPGYVGWRGSL